MAKGQENTTPKLTAKQERFAQEYLLDLNATQAAIRAGYSDKSAREIGCRMLTNVDVLDYIEKRKAQLDQQLENKYLISKERVLAEYARIGFSDIRGFYNESGGLRNITELNDDQAASLAGVKSHEQFTYVEGDKMPDGVIKEIKVYDKLRALEGIRKVMGYDAPVKQDITSNGKGFADFLKASSALKTDETKED